MNFKNKITKETIFLNTEGTGRDTKGVVEQAIVEREKLSVESKKEVDVVWAVFDKDDADENATKIKRFEDAFEIAKDNNIETAYSNEVFELWLLLHLSEVDANVALPRAEIYKLLQENIRTYKGYNTFEYEHGNTSILQIIYEIGSKEDAINRAKTLYFENRVYWDDMVVRDMNKDVSWEQSAKQYKDMYVELTPRY